MQPVEVAPGVVAGGPRLVLIAGPCVIESDDHAVDMAGRLGEVARRFEALEERCEEGAEACRAKEAALRAR